MVSIRSSDHFAPQLSHATRVGTRYGSPEENRCELAGCLLAVEVTVLP
jgi:hypothetical protein